MEITDYDINIDRKNNFTIISNILEAEVNSKDFFEFMAEHKGWFFDEGDFIVIPNEDLVLKNGDLISICPKVTVYDFEGFCKKFTTSLTDLFECYANQNELDWWGEEMEDEDTQGDSYMDFRRDQAA